MYSVQSSKSFLVGHRHVEVIGSSKERNKISDNISDTAYKQGQIWLVRRQDLNFWYGRPLRPLRPGGTVSQIFGAGRGIAWQGKNNVTSVCQKQSKMHNSHKKCAAWKKPPPWKKEKHTYTYHYADYLLCHPIMGFLHGFTAATT